MSPVSVRLPKAVSRLRRGHQQFSLLHGDLSLPSVRARQREGEEVLCLTAVVVFLWNAAAPAMLSAPAQRPPGLAFNTIGQVEIMILLFSPPSCQSLFTSTFYQAHVGDQVGG